MDSIGFLKFDVFFYWLDISSAGIGLDDPNQFSVKFIAPEYKARARFSSIALRNYIV